MEMAETLKHEKPVDDDIEVKSSKRLIWNSMSSKAVQSWVESSSTNVFTTSDQVINTVTSSSVLIASKNLVLGLRMQNRNEFLSNTKTPASSGYFMSNNSIGGPTHKVEFLDTMEL
eukprot:15366392-Ditylum_brightwellii.AAC.1